MRLIWIPLVFILLRLPSCMRTVQDIIWGKREITWLSVLQVIGDPGQGVANGVCFVLCRGDICKRYLLLYFSYLSMLFLPILLIHHVLMLQIRSM
jgi:hypothetical protein